MTQTLPFLQDIQGMAPLTHWGVVRAQGEDAASFLHSQLTQDVTQLTAGQARLAGYCSAKGRLLATFIVWRPQPDTVWLLARADVLAAMVKRLSMFVLRARCKLVDASEDFHIDGLIGSACLAALGDAAPQQAWQTATQADTTVLRLPDVDGMPRFVRMAPRDATAPALPPLPVEAWRFFEVRSGLPMISAATAEQFVPQMINLEVVGGVNFQKGCYPGQEVVARSQYRGTLKRRMFLFELSEASASAGQEVFHSLDSEQPAGMVVDAAALPGGPSLALVEIKLAALEEGSLHLGRADGPQLKQTALPYDVPLLNN